MSKKIRKALLKGLKIRVHEYKPGYDDYTIARDLGVSPEEVERLRTKYFGRHSLLPMDDDEGLTPIQNLSTVKAAHNRLMSLFLDPNRPIGVAPDFETAVIHETDKGTYYLEGSDDETD